MGFNNTGQYLESIEMEQQYNSWQGEDGTSVRLSELEENMIKYVAVGGRSLHNSSTIGHNCLLESVLVALEDSGDVAYFDMYDDTVELFKKSYTEIRQWIVHHMRENANVQYHNTKDLDNVGGTLSYADDYKYDPLSRNITWEQYLTLLEGNEFLDLRCLMVLCHNLNNIKIDIIKFLNVNTPPVILVCESAAKYALEMKRYSITIAVRQDQHFYAVIQPNMWLEEETNVFWNCPTLRVPVRVVGTKDIRHLQIEQENMIHELHEIIEYNVRENTTVEIMIGTLNVCTLGEPSVVAGDESNKRLARLPLYLSEFNRKGLDIVCLQECRIRGPGECIMDEYKCYFSVIPDGRRMYGVGIAVK